MGLTALAVLEKLVELIGLAELAELARMAELIELAKLVGMAGREQTVMLPGVEGLLARAYNSAEGSNVGLQSELIEVAEQWNPRMKKAAGRP